MYTCKICSEKDKMYSFKVLGHTTEVIGRKNEESNFYYIQAEDGLVIKYDAYRVVQAKELDYSFFINTKNITTEDIRDIVESSIVESSVEDHTDLNDLTNTLLGLVKVLSKIKI